METKTPHLVLSDKIPDCNHFTWGEVLWLPTWKLHVYPSDEQCLNLVKICIKLDWIRDYFGYPIKVTSGLRPEIYNRTIGGAFHSAHITGEAVDFQVAGMKPNAVRAKLKPMLTHLGLRMENLPDSNWVHIDNKMTGHGGARFFTP